MPSTTYGVRSRSKYSICRSSATGIDGEANRRMGLLCLLYHSRRLNQDDPGLSLSSSKTR